MTIILLTTSLEKSAVTTQLIELARYLGNNGNKVVLISHETLSLEAWNIYQKLSVSVHSLQCNRWQICKGIRVFRELQKKLCPDIIHCHLGRAYIIGLLGRLKSTKVIATFHNEKNYFGFLTRSFLSFYYKKFDGITAVSHTALKSYKLDTNKPLKCKIQAIYNPVFLTVTQHKEEILPKVMTKNFFVIGVINRFVKGKGYDRWFNLIREMTSKKIVSHNKVPAFWTAGEGPLEDVYKKKVNENNIPHTYFLGYRTDITTLIQKSQLIVYPTNNEGFGLVLYESLLLGVPVLAQKLAVFEELLGKDSWWLVDFHNVAETYSKIQYFAKNYADVQKQAIQDGNKFRDTLSPSTIFEQYNIFYNDCLSS